MADRPFVTVDPHKSFATQLKERTRAPIAAGAGDSLYERLRTRLDKVTVDGVELYVAEGDTLLDEDQLWLYAMFREENEREAHNRNMAAVGGMATARLLQPPSQPSGLLGIIDEDGNFVRWPADFIITYCVLRKTFAGADRDEHYEMVVDNMRAATGEWEAVCNIRFEYKPELDDSDGVRPDGVVFPVRELNTGGRFIAAAFFPNDPTDRRRVLIDPTYYPESLRFDKVGVLRHELGHVLGFRHEHIRSGAPAECHRPNLREDLQGTLDLTQYDPRSVMHYFCGEVGSRELAITDLDRMGAERLYGPPGGGAGLVGETGPAAAAFAAPLPTVYVR